MMWLIEIWIQAGLFFYAKTTSFLGKYSKKGVIFKIFPQPSAILVNGIFSLPLDAAKECTPTRYSMVRVVKYWIKLPASVVAALSVNVFKKRLENVWTEVFPHLPHWLNSHLLIPLPPPPSHLHTTNLKLSVLYVTQLPILSLSFRQARCSLLFTIISIIIITWYWW